MVQWESYELTQTTMPLIEKHHIIDLFCAVEELHPRSPRTGPGRPVLMSENEVITAVIYHILIERAHTLKDIHHNLIRYHRDDFPRIPQYSAFVDQCHTALPVMMALLKLLLADTAPVRLLDSTMLPVCKIHRADRHKVAQRIAHFGKNNQGWHYGFKLHASIDPAGRLCGIALTSANVYDAHAMKATLNEYCILACGDTHYGARVMGGKIKEWYGTAIIAPPHPKQKKKIAAKWQLAFLAARSKIEAVFDILKEHLGLVSSFPRSERGYLLRYVSVLLAYQLSVL